MADNANKKETLKGIIKQLHAGVSAAELKQKFAEVVKDVSPSEIAAIEQELVREGMAETEIKRLCDVHVQVFKEGLESQEKPLADPGHPVHTFMLENTALNNVAAKISTLLDMLGSPPDKEKFAQIVSQLQYDLDKLAQVDKHYQRKENQLFPYLEKHGITAPTKVMWIFHDDIRGMIKKMRKAIVEVDIAQVVEKGKELTKAVVDMAYKENKILFPMSLQKIDKDEWVEIARGEKDIGYALIKPAAEWGAKTDTAPDAPQKPDGALNLNTGALTLKQIDLLLRNLPVDVTFIDENDEVKYFSAGKERIFPRSPGIIGRKVQNCHPPKSVNYVNKILEAFKTGEKDSADFHIQMAGKHISIAYYAVRDENGEYCGTLEFSQDVTEIRKLEGEKRLLDWKE